MLAQPIAAMTEAEYLAFERANEARHEYYQGQVYEMLGITMRHRNNVMNTAMGLHGQDRGTDCSILFTNMRIKVQATGMYAYPDILTICGKAQLEDSHEDTLLNPYSTKWLNYQEMESLQEFLIIGHDRPLIQHYVRHGPRTWNYRMTTDMDLAVTLPTINCTLAFSEVYQRINFEQ